MLHSPCCLPSLIRVECDVCAGFAGPGILCFEFVMWGSGVRRFSVRSPRVAYASAGLALVVALAALGMSGHGLPALGMQLRSGQAWLANVANHSISFIDGYSGEVASQVSDPGGTPQVVDTPEGAVVVGKNGHLITVSNDNFTTSGSVELLGGGSLTAAGGGSNALYAINEAAGQIQQLDASSPQLPPIGPPVSVGAPIVTPVVAPDGSLYIGIPKTGSVGHVIKDQLALIKGIAPAGARLAVVLAGTQPVAADLNAGVMLPLGATSIIGRGVQLPARARPVQELVGSDSLNGLVGAVGGHGVVSANVTTDAMTSTPLPSWFNPTATAMQGTNMMLIDGAVREMLFVDTLHRISHVLTMPGTLPPDQVTVQDGLFFVNSSDGPHAMVINGSGQWKPVIKYTTQPTPPKHAVLPAPPTTKVRPDRGPPKPPSAPVNPRGLAGNATATVSWGAAPDNGSPITSYRLSWTGNGSSGSATLPGYAGGKVVTGLSNGVSYVFSVKAKNALGWGPAVQTAPVTPSSHTPAAPVGVKATVTTDNGSVSLTWTAPDNGYQIQSYTVTEVGTGTQVATNVTGTSTVIPGVVTGTSASFGPVAFTVLAVNAANRTSAQSAPSNAVTPYLPPLAPTAIVTGYTQNGNQATLSVSCPPVTCLRGSVSSYTVTPANGAQPVTVTAVLGGAATQVTLTGLTPDTSYTAQVIALDARQTTGPPGSVSLDTWGPPIVNTVTVSAPGAGTSAAVDVTATVNPGGEPLSSCSVTITVGGGTGSGACGATIAVNVQMYNTPYTATVTATNNDGTATGSGSGTSNLKALTANASTAFGTSCSPGVTYCGGASHLQPTPAFTTTASNLLINEGAAVVASCQTTGTVDHGTQPGYTGGSNVWLYISSSPVGAGYMSNLWFGDPSTSASGLPSC
jgi:Fibronectin type III domain